MNKAKLASVVGVQKRSKKLSPVPMTLSGPSGKRVVVSTAKRVIKTHGEVIKALAKR